MDRYWQEVFRVCGVDVPPYVQTLVPGPVIRGYYNGGLVVMRRKCGLAKLWLDFLRRIDPTTTKMRRYLDQFSLAAVAAALPDRVLHLPPEYNYNIRNRGELPKRIRSIDIDELVHVHYHNAFARPNFLTTAWPELDPQSERFKWLLARLPLEPTQKRARRKYFLRKRLKRGFLQFVRRSFTV